MTNVNVFIPSLIPATSCINSVNPSSSLPMTGSNDSAIDAPASFKLSTAVENLPSAVCDNRSIAPAAKPPSCANDFSTSLNWSTLTAPAPSASAGSPVASDSSRKIGIPRSASWFRFSSSTLPFALTFAKIAAISSTLLPDVAAMSPKNCNCSLIFSTGVPAASNCRAAFAMFSI